MLIATTPAAPQCNRFVQYLNNRCRYDDITPFGNDKNPAPICRSNIV